VTGPTAKSGGRGHRSVAQGGGSVLLLAARPARTAARSRPPLPHDQAPDLPSEAFPPRPLRPLERARLTESPTPMAPSVSQPRPATICRTTRGKRAPQRRAARSPQTETPPSRRRSRSPSSRRLPYDRYASAPVLFPSPAPPAPPSSARRRARRHWAVKSNNAAASSGNVGRHGPRGEVHRVLPGVARAGERRDERDAATLTSRATTKLRHCGQSERRRSGSAAAASRRSAARPHRRRHRDRHADVR